MARNSFGIIMFILSLVVGAYLINYPFTFITMPAFLINIEKWILFLGGVLVILGGINYFRARNRY